MAEIRINPDQVEQSGNQFSTKRGELESLVSQANALINNLRSAFVGQRATAIYQEWDGMQGNLKTAIQTLDQASMLLKRAANDFRSADSAR